MANTLPLPSVNFTVDDRGGQYFAKLQQLAAAIDTCVAAYNASVNAGVDASDYLQQVQDLQGQIVLSLQDAIAEMQQIRDDTQVISASGLPAQPGNANKALITDGDTLAWGHTWGFTPDNTLTQLNPGDRRLMLITTDAPVSMPALISAGQPFVIRNSAASTARIKLALQHELVTTKETLAPGSIINIEPGTTWPMVAISNTQLELTI